MIYLSIAGNELSEDQIQSLVVISSNLKWALGTFSLFVLGGKGVGAFRDRQVGVENDFQHEQENNHRWRKNENPFADDEEIN